MKALYFNEFGDSTVLKYGDVPTPKIKEDEVLVKIIYTGVNFADIYRRKGNYHLEKRENMPFINGYEGTDEIVKVGAKVTKYKIGNRVFFVDVPFATAEFVAVNEANAISVPESLDLAVVASIGLQGLTADFLAHDLGKNKVGDAVFLYGITGGVGQILSQMLTADGMVVFGLTSTDDKKELALKQGAKKVFLRNEEWLKDYLGYFNTVYDGVGSTLLESIELVQNRGAVVLFGMAGGNPPKIDVIDLFTKSKSILTGDLWDYLPTAEEREIRSNRLFSYFIDKKIIISKPTIFKLSEGKMAYDLLESGKSVGKILLQP